MKSRSLIVAACVAAGTFTAFGLAQEAEQVAPAAAEVAAPAVPADAVPYRAPGSKITGLRKGNDTYYDGGKVVVTAAAAALPPWSCSAGAFCLYDYADGTGTRVQVWTAGAYTYLSSLGFNDRANSWRNTRSTGTYIDENTNGATGWRICANPGNAAIPQGQRNQASAVFIRANGYC